MRVSLHCQVSLLAGTLHYCSEQLASTKICGRDERADTASRLIGCRGIGWHRTYTRKWKAEFVSRGQLSCVKALLLHL